MDICAFVYVCVYVCVHACVRVLVCVCLSTFEAKVTSKVAETVIGKLILIANLYSLPSIYIMGVAQVTQIAASHSQ